MPVTTLEMCKLHKTYGQTVSGYSFLRCKHSACALSPTRPAIEVWMVPLVIPGVTLPLKFFMSSCLKRSHTQTLEISHLHFGRDGKPVEQCFRRNEQGDSVFRTGFWHQNDAQFQWTQINCFPKAQKLPAGKFRGFGLRTPNYKMFLKFNGKKRHEDPLDTYAFNKGCKVLIVWKTSN